MAAPAERPPRYGAIDLGTNSFHLVIVQVDEEGRYEVLTREKDSVRLGRGAADLEGITPEAMERGVAVLKRMTELARSQSAELRAVGTSALREASNQSEFLERVRRECGLEIEVIPGTEEARLIYLGVLQALPVQKERVVVIDIGGGSTEFLVGEGGQVALAASLKLGAIRLTDRYFSDDQLTPSRIRKCRKFVRVALAGIVEQIEQAGFQRAIGSSGTIETMVELARSLSAFESTDERTVTRLELEQACEAVLSRKTAAERAALPGVGETRADIIPAGAVLLQEIVRLLDIEKITVSAFALREGIVFDTLSRMGLRSGPSGDLRRASVGHLAESFARTGTFDAEAGRHTARLAVRILEQCVALGLLPDTALREIPQLEAAAILHNIGLTIAHSSHHKHSMYIIANSQKLMGFSPRELQLVALLARYHRKALPSKKHVEFTGAPEAVQEKVQLLGPILRIAVGLERSGHGRVADVQLRLEDNTVEFAVTPVEQLATDLNVEIWAARMKAHWFESRYGKATDFRTVYP